MYIACPACDTKFLVTQEQIGKRGRKVKCSKCSHIWYHKPDNPVRIEPTILIAAPSELKPLGNGVNLPVLLPVKIQPYLYTLPVLMIGIIFMMVMLFPNNLGFDSLLNSNQLSIKDMRIENHKEIDKITVSYKVLNNSLKTPKMPLVRIRLFDKSDRILKSLIDDHTDIDISPSRFIQVKTEFIPAPPSTESIDIMIGNRIDFILR